MARLRLELWRRLRSELGEWQPAPLYAAVFGSAARGDGDTASDIDLLLVHPPFLGETPPRRKQETWLAPLLDAASIASLGRSGLPAEPELWQRQVDRLRGLVQGWTGNELQVVDLSVYEWWRPRDAHKALLAEVRRDGVEVARSDKLPSVALTGAAVG